MAQLAQRLQAGGLLLVDVRSAAEFARGCASVAARCALRTTRLMALRCLPGVWLAR